MVLELLDALNSSAKSDVERTLRSLLHETKKIASVEEPDTRLEQIFNADLTNSLFGLLSKFEDKSVLSLTLQVLAELAKTDAGRSLCIDEKFIKLIVAHISDPSDLPDPSGNTSFQACRALGNICFECDIARNLVNKIGGEKDLLTVLTNLCNNNGSQEHVRVACGALMNMIVDHDALQTSVLSLGALELCSKIIRNFHGCDDVIKIILNILEIFCDRPENLDGFFGSDEHMDGLYILLKTSNNPEITDAVFLILNTAAEKDELKTAISSTLLPEKLCRLIEERESSDETKFVGLASDFVVLLLTGDKSMDALFANGEGNVFLMLSSWLSMSRTIKLQTSAAFALCNIARSDKNCVHFVERGIADDIITHLEHYPVDVYQPVLQHALLGTLTNLSITTQNKAKMIDKGVVEISLRYLDSESFTVVFKSLGSLRMLLNRSYKTACQLGANEDFLKKLDHFSDLKEHEGIKCESWRIFAYIITYSHESEVLKTVLKYNVVEYLFRLSQSEHMKMKHEAVLSFVILIICLGINILEKQEERLSEALKGILSTGSELPEDVLHNILVLVEKCQESPDIRAVFKENGLYDVLKDFPDGKVKHLLETRQ